MTVERPADSANRPSCEKRGKTPCGERFCQRSFLAWVATIVAFGLSVSVASNVRAAQTAKKPKHRDTLAKLTPPEITFKASVKPAAAAPGETVTYTVETTVDEGWHVYAFAKKQPDGGPRSTQFDFFDPAGLTLSGDWKADQPPIKRKETAFPDLDSVEFYEGKVSWSVQLKVPADAKPGKADLRCQVFFQICDKNSCKPPSYRTLPTATLTVKSKPSALLAPESLSLLTIGFIETPAAASASSTPKAAAAKSEIQEAIDKGFWYFLLKCAGGGFLALLMPCVWPMVPVTVNFFLKQGQKKKGKTTGLAITYCLTIIGFYTLIGVAFSAFFVGTSLNRLANNPWLNLAVAGIFIAFGVSLLGLFEIGVPSFLVNASSKGEGRGGLIGVGFMAVTLTLTSFTCTFPVVGGLLVIASRGNYLYPIVGLTTFATVLALPFFLLALAPGLMSKLPKSGDWMNAVKVVGGLVEIGAAFKFLNTAEIGFGSTPTDAWFDSNVLLAVWVVLCVVCSLYVLGIFKSDHDIEDVRVGPGRLLFGIAFMSIALYLAPALFGFPPQGRVYTRLVVGLLPNDSGRLDGRAQLALNAPSATAADGSKVPAEIVREAKATSKDPKEAIRQEVSVHGVAWGFSYDSAIEQAKKTGRPVLIDFTGVNCENCRLMERSVMSKPEVIALLKKFVTVQQYTDFVPIDSIKQEQREELAEENLTREVDLTSQQTSPLYVVLNAEGKVLAQIGGFNEPPVFVNFLNQALAKHDGPVARNDPASKSGE